MLRLTLAPSPSGCSLLRSFFTTTLGFRNFGPSVSAIDALLTPELSAPLPEISKENDLLLKRRTPRRASRRNTEQNCRRVLTVIDPAPLRSKEPLGIYLRRCGFPLAFITHKWSLTHLLLLVRPLSLLSVRLPRPEWHFLQTERSQELSKPRIFRQS
jgi:hypothetical protein